MIKFWIPRRTASENGLNPVVRSYNCNDGAVLQEINGPCLWNAHFCIYGINVLVTADCSDPGACFWVERGLWLMGLGTKSKILYLSSKIYSTLERIGYPLNGIIEWHHLLGKQWGIIKEPESQQRVVVLFIYWWECTFSLSSFGKCTVKSLPSLKYVQRSENWAPQKLL